MSQLLAHHDTACRRLRACGLSKQITLNIIDQVHKYVRKNGEEWTVNRLKVLKVGYINHLAGNKPDLPWIKNKSGIPTGVFGHIYRLKNQQRALVALMVYSEAIAKEILPSQRKKFLTALGDDPNATAKNLELDISNMNKSRKTLALDGNVDESDDSYFFYKGITSVLDADPSQRSRLRDSHLSLAYIKHQFKRHQRLDRIDWLNEISQLASRKVRRPMFVEEIDESLPLDEQIELSCSGDAVMLKTADNSVEMVTSYGDHPIAVQWFESEIKQSLPDELERIYYDGQLSPSLANNQSVAGRIGFMQEPGLKLRTAANPLGVLQLISTRLGNQVYNSLRMIPEDATFNQDKAVQEVRDRLDRDHPETGLMSIDLSSATDRFPLGFQIHVLRGCGAQESDINLFKSISRSKWRTPDGQYVSWKVGQPLGWYPSFGVFALSHHVLARIAIFIAAKIERDKGNTTIDASTISFYRILGDDIVIDRRAGKLLRSFYKILGCPVSESKSLDSNLIAEFGGRIISRDRVLVQPKWRAPSDRSFLDLAKNLGPQSTPLFTKRQRDVLEVLAHVLPEHPQGLNWNTHGWDYDRRKALTELLLNDEEVTKGLDLPDAVMWLSMIHLRYNLSSEISRLDYDYLPPTLHFTESLSREGNLLTACKVISADFKDRIPPSWYPSREIIDGDPRGKSLLEILEQNIRQIPKQVLPVPQHRKAPRPR